MVQPPGAPPERREEDARAARAPRLLLHEAHAAPAALEALRPPARHPWHVASQGRLAHRRAHAADPARTPIARRRASRFGMGGRESARLHRSDVPPRRSLLVVRLAR